MAWQEPSGKDPKKDPWGNNKNQNPPDLDKIIADFFKRMFNLLKFDQKPSAGKLPQRPDFENHVKWTLVLLPLILLVLWIAAGFFIVNPAEETVVLRLGQYAETAAPGLHWMAPLIDQKYTVDVQKIYSFAIQNDVLTKSSEQSDLPNQVVVHAQPDPDVLDPADRSKNVVNVELTVQYRVQDARAFLFNVVNPDETIREVTSGALSEVIGKMKLDEVLTTGREYLSAGVIARIKAVLVNYKTGLDVTAVTLRKVQAPDQVKAAFNDVNRADQDKSTYIQQAQAYASKVVPLAQGDAARILADASGYKQQVFLNAQAQIAKYLALLSVYQVSPDVMRARMYLETMQNIYAHTSKILLDVNGSNNMFYLPLDKLMSSKHDVIVPDEPETAPNSDTPLNLSANQIGQALGVKHEVA